MYRQKIISSYQTIRELTRVKTISYTIVYTIYFITSKELIRPPNLISRVELLRESDVGQTSMPHHISL